MVVEVERVTIRGTAGFPINRPRRLRRTAALRNLARETRLSTADVILPLFVRPGRDLEIPITSMPGQSQWSVDRLVRRGARVSRLGIPAVMLFGIPEQKDDRGSENWDPTGSSRARSGRSRTPCRRWS